MNKKLTMVLAVSISAMLVFSGCSKGAGGDSGSGNNGTTAEEQAEAALEKVAKVNDSIILKEDYDKNFALIEKRYNDQYGDTIWSQESSGKSMRDVVREQLLDDMITEVVIIQSIEATGFVAPVEKVESSYAELVTYFEENQEVKKFYDEVGVDETFIKKQIEKQLMVDEFYRIEQSHVEKDTAKLEALYDIEIVKVDASHILVEELELANDLMGRLKNGEDFAELAKEFSKDPGSGANGGALGFFTRGRMVPEFESAAFSTEKNAISDIIQTDYGFHIILVNDRLTINQLIEKEGETEEVIMLKKGIVNSLVGPMVSKAQKELIDAATIEKMEENIQ